MHINQCVKREMRNVEHKRQKLYGGKDIQQAYISPFTFHVSHQYGVTLIELVVFIVVLSIGLTAMVTAMNNHLSNSVDPIVNTRALECAQAKLDEISARKFDENSPTGGVPACGSGEERK